MKVALRDDIDFIARRFRPAHEMPLIAGPSGGCIFLAVTIGISPFHMRIARLGHHRRRRHQRRTRRIGRQRDKALGVGAMDAEHGREEIAIRAGEALIVVRSAPVIIGCPGRGRSNQQKTAGRCLGRLRAHDQQMIMRVGNRAFIQAARSHDIDTGSPIRADLEFKRNRPVAALHRAVIGKWM